MTPSRNDRSPPTRVDRHFQFWGLLYTLGIIGILMSILPMFQYTGGTTGNKSQAAHLAAHPDDMPFVQEFRFGWGGSPLVLHRTEQTLHETAPGRFEPRRTASTVIGWISRSAAALVVGIALLVTARCIRPRETHRQSAPGV
jgi:hypothetical protein